MANMSYCRFENTAGDLHDCVSAMEDAECIVDLDLNTYEYNAMVSMAELCRKFVQQYEALTETFDE